ncbi:MAG: glycosyltransferase family 2 protein [Winogradskyella sp.]|nr:glycosyltransferase family 2 protein [Winogradskyella sp.]
MENKIIEIQDKITGNENNLNPLVSIIILTYNSSKYVLETLESAKAQSYRNIELIVSDDCSTDNTVEICEIWIEANKDCFIKSEIICTETNTGIPANCNRALNNAKGEWIKYIAGDDILEKECITSFVNFCLSEPKARIVESISQFFK